MSVLDWVVIAGYFVATILIGLSFSHRASGGVEEFFLAGRKLPWWLAGGSMVAGMFASDTPLFHSGNVRDMGLSACWLFFVPMFGALLAAALIARLVRRTRVVTDAEFIELRYSGKTPAPYRGFLAFYSGIFIASLTMGWVTLGMVTIVSQILGWSKVFSIVLLLGIVVVYASAAGMWGIVMTDVFQYTIATLGSLFLAIVAVRECGGLAALRHGLAAIPGYPGADLHFLPTGKEFVYSTKQAFMSLPLLFTWIFVNGAGQASATGEQGQRILACRSEKDASLTYVMFSFCYYGFNGLCWVIVGLASVLLLGATNQMAGLHDSTRAFPAMIVRLMPVGFRGLMIAAMFASFMSATSVLLNWGSSYVVNDLYRRFLVPHASQKHYVLASRLACVLVAICGGFFSMQFDNLKDYFSLVPALINGPVLVLLFRYLWWRINIWSEISAMVSAPFIGFYVEFVLGARGHAAFLSGLPGYGMWYSQNDWLFFGQRLATTVAATTLCWVTVTLLTRPTDMEKLKRFYLQVRPPGPGWAYVRRQIENPPPLEPGWAQFTVWISSIAFVLGAIYAVVEVIRGSGGMAVLVGALSLASLAVMNRGMDVIDRYAVVHEEAVTEQPERAPVHV